MNENEAELRRGVLDLSIMLKGMDQELDGALDNLKHVLRKRGELDADAFRDALEAADARFDQIEGWAETGTHQLYHLYQSLVDLDTEAAPRSFSLAVKEQHRYLFDALKLAEDALRLIPDSRPSQQDNASTEKLKRLHQKLCSRFITLLRTLAILGDEDGALQSLARRLEPMPDWPELDGLAEETIALIQRRLDAEKGQFQYYLNQLNEKLRSINELIGQNKQAVSELTELNANLDQQVDSQIARAKAAITQAVNMEQLRASLNDSIDGLLSLLNDFQTQTRNSLIAMNRRQQELNQHLDALQEDNHRLIKQVTQEREIARRDPLTQLPNRQGFDQRLAQEIARSDRYGQPLSVALIDVDHFKQINDRYGHLAGDRVLRILAKEMHSQLRKTDFLARYGGEEFVILLPESDQNSALAAIEKMREHISQCPFHFQDSPVKISISAGIAVHQPNEEAEHWLHRADKALYQSKDGGRNRTTVSDENL
ncbi:GGDEF domain-containing protein [Saccharospirillum mangrovi]|uniref:GGDEF domain-containing protein n=1 Tax=Saccharospirillum mangrovi TaxID=2161747 RepID=UPI000D3C587E|nr:GGDEF domain-containing protein [Saccharospirillum mangrovi]